MQNINQPPLWLLILLIMFPQLVQTIYSPALPDIASSFRVSSEQAAQTLSVYFVSFAIGVVLWGWLSDRIGISKRHKNSYIICSENKVLMSH
nr:MFS transporter [Candidatus Hamiltonella defensa]